MNSKQRRRDRRRWQYQVELPEERVGVQRYNDIFDWCVATWGNGPKCTGWREKHGHFGTCWQFATKKQAVMFAMRWR